MSRVVTGNHTSSAAHTFTFVEGRINNTVAVKLIGGNYFTERRTDKIRKLLITVLGKEK